MERKWGYVLVMFALMGLVIAVGSAAATADANSGSTLAAPSSGVTSGSAITSSLTVYPNAEYVGYVNATGYTPIVTVPANMILFIDDVQFVNVGSSVTAIGLYRGVPGTNIMLTHQVLPAPPNGNILRSYKNLFLNSGEQLKIYSSSFNMAYYTITGHFALRP